MNKSTKRMSLDRKKTVKGRGIDPLSSVNVKHFLKGIGSTIDITGAYFVKNKSAAGLRGDAKKIRKDWEIISKDMQNAMNLF
jgi:hypothetical protein